MTTTGFAGLTIGGLAEHTGMSKSGLFARFGSKEELQLALLDEMQRVVAATVLSPALQAAAGLPRLRALVERWFGWTSRAGLSGGCPVAAGLFELDDQPGPLRERLLTLEAEWRGLLCGLVSEAVALGELRADLNVDQFVWELCGIYLSHHASTRFLRTPHADTYAHRAFEALLERAAA